MTGNDARALFGAVTPHEGETLLSIIARSAEANVHPRLGSFLRLAGINTLRPAYVPFTRIDDAEGLARRIGISPVEVLRRTHSLMAAGAGGRINWYGTPLPRLLVDAEVYRFSPAALEHASFQRAQWMLRPLTFCPETMELLTSECPRCGHKQVWKYRSSMDICERCRAPLTRAKAPLIHADLRKDAKQAAGLVDPSEAKRSHVLASIPHPFAGWEGGDVFSAAIELGAMLSNERVAERVLKVKRGDFTEYSAENLVEGFRFIKDWPASLERQLPQWLDLQRSCELRKCIGPLSRYFGPAAPTKLRDLVREEVPKMLSRMAITPSASRLQRVDWISTSGTISQKAASVEYKIDAATLRRLRTTGNPANLAKCARGDSLFDKELLGKSVSVLRDSVTARNCAKVLGVPDYSIDAIVKRGLLVPVSDADANTLSSCAIYDSRSLLALKSRLKSVPRHRSEVGIAVSDLLHNRMHPEDWADTIEAVLSGHLKKAALNSDSSAKFQDITVEYRGGERFLSMLPERPAPLDIWLCRSAAASLLRLRAWLVSDAIKQELLPAKVKNGKGHAVSLSELSTFNTKFFFSIEAKRRLGIDSASFARRMIAAGFLPLAKIGNTHVWCRADADRLIRSAAITIGR
jgi:hypothetical protein